MPVYIVPGPIAIVGAFLADPARLLTSLASTLLGHVRGADRRRRRWASRWRSAMAASRLARAAILPWAVVLQVTPIVAIAPLIIIWVGNPFASLVVVRDDRRVLPGVRQHRDRPGRGAAGAARTCSGCTARGAGSTLTLLRLPAALPYFLAGLRISGGLALVGAVVAEFVAGSGGFASGLAYRILEAGYRLQIPRMFAALVLLSLAGIAINFGLGWFGRLILRRRGEA